MDVEGEANGCIMGLTAAFSFLVIIATFYLKAAGNCSNQKREK